MFTCMFRINFHKSNFLLLLCTCFTCFPVWSFWQSIYYDYIHVISSWTDYSLNSLSFYFYLLSIVWCELNLFYEILIVKEMRQPWIFSFRFPLDRVLWSGYKPTVLVGRFNLHILNSDYLIEHLHLDIQFRVDVESWPSMLKCNVDL